MAEVIGGDCADDIEQEEREGKDGRKKKNIKKERLCGKRERKKRSRKEVIERRKT